MNSGLDDIVLAPVAIEQAPLPAENRYYDAKMRFLKPSGRESNTPTFNIDAIVKQYIDNMSEILQLTLPAQLYTRRRPQQAQAPSLWEMGGLNRGGFGRPSWCVIVGSTTGERVNRHDVCQVRYQTLDKSVHPSGRHALVAVQPETMFIVAQKLNATMHALVYKIDDVLDWPGSEILTLSADRPYVALNCSLVGIRVLKGESAMGWENKKRLSPEEIAGVARLFSLAREKLQTPAYSPCNVELFWDAAPNSAERNQHEAPIDANVVFRTIADPEDFVNDVITTIGEYRKHLNSSELQNRSHPIPLSIKYEIGDDGAVKISVEVPSALPTYDHLDISTVVQSELPASLLAEPCLVWNCASLDELVGKIDKIAGVATRNIFTYC